MNCDNIKKELSSYIDKELASKIMGKIKEHLKSCDSCMREYQNLLDIKKRIHNMEKIDVHPSMALSIIEKIEQQNKSPEYNWFPVTIRVAVLFAIVFNITVFTIFKNYEFKKNDIPMPKPLKVENIIIAEEKETKGNVAVSFSTPYSDTIPEFIPPEIIEMEKPDYPEHMLAEGIDGTVILNIVIDKNGKIAEMEIEKELSPMADSLSLVSAKNMKFKPAQLKEKIVEAAVTITFLFRI
jgi:TonB family protein